MPDPLETTDGRRTDFANHPQFVTLDQNLPALAIIRRVETSAL